MNELIADLERGEEVEYDATEYDDGYEVVIYVGRKKQSVFTSKKQDEVYKAF